MKGTKYSGDKIKYCLIEPDFEEGIAAVLTHGAAKYGENNWQDVPPEEYYSALRRHLKEHLKAMKTGTLKDYLDQDTGLLHLHHLSCCAMFLSYIAVKKNPKLQERIEKNIKDKTFLSDQGLQKGVDYNAKNENV